MDEPSPTAESFPQIELKDPLLAAGFALVWPGAGHLYQRRTGKGILFMVCILGTFIYGWQLGGAKVVYAQWEPGARRWPYLCQLWVGLPAWPAMVQATMNKPLGRNFMAPPGNQRDGNLSQWHKDYAANFELGTVFTMVAGLLNILAVFDAAAGPVVPAPRDKKKRKRKGKSPAEVTDESQEAPASPEPSE